MVRQIKRALDDNEIQRIPERIAMAGAMARSNPVDPEGMSLAPACLFSGCRTPASYDKCRRKYVIGFAVILKSRQF
jgi:hypothetical protein